MCVCARVRACVRAPARGRVLLMRMRPEKKCFRTDVRLYFYLREKAGLFRLLLKSTTSCIQTTTLQFLEAGAIYMRARVRLCVCVCVCVCVCARALVFKFTQYLNRQREQCALSSSRIMSDSATSLFEGQNEIHETYSEQKQSLYL